MKSVSVKNCRSPVLCIIIVYARDGPRRVGWSVPSGKGDFKKPEKSEWLANTSKDSFARSGEF